MANEFVIKNGVKINIIPDLLENLQFILVPDENGFLKKVNVDTFYDETGIQLAVDSATEQAILSAAARDVAEAERILSEQARDLAESYANDALDSSNIALSANTLTLEYKNQAELSAILSTEQATLSAQARNDAEAAKIESEDFSDLSLQYKQDSELAANTSTQQAILSASARDLAEGYANDALNEKIATEDLSDLSLQYKQEAETSANEALSASTLSFQYANETNEAKLKILAERRNDYVDNILYLGKAIENTLESDQLWTIRKIEVFIDGTTSVSIATNVAWTNRLTATYI